MQKEQDRSPAYTYGTGFLSKDTSTEFARLQALERSVDPTGISIIELLPVQPDWKSLEMGAGAGSMAYWLAERCPEGTVVAADLDPRFLDADRLPNLKVSKVDLGNHDFPADSFDLVHGRAVLSHLPDRDEVVGRTLSWLKPGGWLIIEDLLIFPQHEGTSSVFAPFLDALARSSSDQGSDTAWTRQMPGMLVERGVRDVQVRMTPIVTGLGGSCDELWRASIQQFGPFFVEQGTLTKEQLDSLWVALERGGLVDLSFVIVSAWGRSPG